MSLPRHRTATGSARRITSLTEALARRSDDGPLVLDLEDPAVRAVLALYAALKPVANTTSHDFGGEDTVEILRSWFHQIGLDPVETIDALNVRIARTCGPHTRPPRAAGDPPTIDDINLYRVAEHVRAAGVACTISSPGAGLAVLQAGPPADESLWTSPWRAIARPGRSGWGEVPSTATTRALFVGPDDLGETPGIDVRAVGAVTEPDIATLIVAQAQREDPSQPLTAEEIWALGFDACGLRRH